MSGTVRFVVLDGLRGIAAIGVVAFHGLSPFGMRQWLPEAPLAVDFFFMLSAFVVAHAYGARVIAGMTAGRFLALRWIRLFPMHALGLLMGLGIFALRAHAVHEYADTGAVAGVTVLALMFLPSGVDFGSGWHAGFPLNPPAWSLFFEWAANVVWVLALVRMTRRQLAALVCVTATAYVAQAFWLGQVNVGGDYATLYLGACRVAFPFAMGLYLWCRHGGATRGNPSVTMNGRAWTLVGVLVLMIVAGPADEGWARVAVEVAYVCVGFPIVLAVGARTVVSGRLARCFDWLGRVSYPVYIIHYPFIRLLSRWGRDHALRSAEIAGLVLLEVAVVLVVAHVLVTWFDEPVRARLTGWMRRRAATSPQVGIRADR